MITETCFNVAANYAEIISRNQRVLCANPGSVLGELVRLSSPVGNYTAPAGSTSGVSGSVEPISSNAGNFSALVRANTTDGINSPNLHSNELNGMIDNLAGLVRKHLSYAKNTVVPLILQLVERIEFYKTNASPKEAGGNFIIIPEYFPEIASEGLILDTLNRFKGKSYSDPSSMVAVGVKSNDEILALLTTGSKKMDKNISEWLASLPEDFVTKIWQEFFCGGHVGNGNFLYLKMSDVYDRLNKGLAVYLLARKLMTSSETIEGMTLGQYRQLLAEYESTAGITVLDAITKIQFQQKSSTLVTLLDGHSKVVKVNGDLYQKWLETGGSPEILLGLLVSGDRVYSTARIDEKAKKYKDQWQFYVTAFQSREIDNYKVFFKRFLETEIGTMLGDLTETEAQVEVQNTDLKTNIMRMARAEIDKLDEVDKIDSHKLALLLIAKCRFYYTSAYSILSDIAEAGRINPNMDPREAAHLAAINYVADYTADMIAVVK